MTHARSAVAFVGFLTTICAGGVSDALARSANSFDAGVFVLEDPGIDPPLGFQAGLRFASATRDGWGADFLLASAPQHLTVLSDLDAVRNVPLWGWGYLSPRVGVSAVLGPYRNVGLNAGLGVVTGVRYNLGLRFDVARRAAWADKELNPSPEWSVSAGLVFFSRP